MKAFSDLEQSKKLAEILPLESADMFYVYDRHLDKLYGDIPYVIGYKVLNENVDIPCWSLAALLDIIPEPVLTYIDKDGWNISTFENNHFKEEVISSNPIDACVEMIMDYEKAYKDALERAKKLYEQGTITESLSNVFPELKESEDEKISREITEFILTHRIDEPNDIEDTNSWLVWLEKQGNTNETIDSDELAQGILRGAAINLITWIDYNAAEGNMCLSNVQCKEIENALVRGDWNKIYAYMKKKLEKQDEKKHIFDFIDWQPSKVDGKIHNIYNSGVEPKFKVGKWITDGKALLRIIKFETDYGYELKAIDGEVFHFVSPDLVEANYHLWTIADAKDGDVLAFEDDSYILLVKELHSTIYGMRVSCYCHVLIGKFETAEYQIRVDGLYPATKEQRDLLFAKMHEEGYEWDAIKKELRKIEKQAPKSKWSEEDSSMQLTLMRDIEQVSFISKEGKDERIMWLNKLDDRFRQNTNDIQKSKWTEEDDKNLESIDIILFEYKDLPKENYWKMINWLKSLKQRMGGEK